jgi:tRNA splicing ligase
MNTTTGNQQSEINYKRMLSLLQANHHTVFGNLNDHILTLKSALQENKLNTFFLVYNNYNNQNDILSLLQSVQIVDSIDLSPAQELAESLDQIRVDNGDRDLATRLYYAERNFVYLLKQVYTNYQSYYMARLVDAEGTDAATQTIQQVVSMYPNRPLAIGFSVLGMSLIGVSLAWFLADRYSI